MFSLSKDWKGRTHDFILATVDRMTKKVFYKAIRKDLTAEALAKLLLAFWVRHYGVSDSMYIKISVIRVLFFLGYQAKVEHCLLKNSTTEVFFEAFVSYEQKDWVMKKASSGCMRSMVRA